MSLCIRSRCCGAGVAALIVSCLHTLGCGLSWDKPKAHFDGVDEQGHVLFVDSLGTLDLGNDLKMPLYAMFKSDWTGTSPLLGQGWMLPLLESRIVQTDENTFLLWQPDGWYQHLGRDKSNDTILNGQRGWKAVVEGNKITVWADCGWKLTYVNGKLTSMITPQNRTLDLAYENGVVTGLQEKGDTVLKVEFNSSTGIVTGLTFNNKTIGIEQAERPVIQQLAGQNIIANMSQSLSKLTFPDGSVKTYSFKTDQTLLPVITLDGQRRITWNSATSLIKTDGDWTYDLKPLEGSSKVAFTRINRQGKSESYVDNGEKGVVSEKNQNGIETKTYRFTSGILAGKIRKIEEIQNGVSTIIFSAAYDEEGKLLRKSTPNETVIYKVLNGKSVPLQVIKNNKIVRNYSYDEKGNFLNLDIVSK